MRIAAALLGTVLLLTGASVAAEEEEHDPFRAWPKAAAETQQALERALNEIPSAERMRSWHDLFCEEAHPAGSEADGRMIEKLAKAFEAMGLETKREAFHAYLPKFESARVAVQFGDQVKLLPVTEAPIPTDPSIAHVVPPAFNAYSASGAVQGQVVYANYGTKADFEKLEALGVSCKGRVVLARYGKNYRGFKAKYAQAAGAAGLLMYTDPDDSGWRKGLAYPQGGWADGAYIQRGSIKTLPYAGDPLTPFEPATKDAKRLDPAQVALPKIPVQPIGWSAAREILSRMQGEPVPKGWQGGLPFVYRVTGGVGLTAHLTVKQTRRVVPSANVIAHIPGAKHPKQMIVIGCHFDAWTFGAGDPHAGTIVLYEMARSFATLLEAGKRPARTIVFANWGAEEFGIIGSTEWCEAQREDLAAHGVAYINLDMAAMGPDFRSAAAPLLKQVIEDATRVVPQARGEKGQTVHAAWTAKNEGAAKFGNLGGGSDHVGFYCHLGIPSCSLGGGGSEGVSYHSAYDTLGWYRKVVGDDYEPALMLARVGNVLVARLANAPLLPYAIERPAEDMVTHLKTVVEKRAPDERDNQLVPVFTATEQLGSGARHVATELARAVSSGGLDAETLRRANQHLLLLEREWLLPEGLPGRPWYRSAYAASDPWSGYASWMLPLLRSAIEHEADVGLAQAADAYEKILAGYAMRVSALDFLLQKAESR